MTGAEALEIASAFLEERLGSSPNETWRVDAMEDHGVAWSVRYEFLSQPWTHRLARYETVVVPRSGAHPWMAWVGRSVEEQIRAADREAR
jgi:hypothetical protein